MDNTIKNLPQHVQDALAGMQKEDYWAFLGVFGRYVEETACDAVEIWQRLGATFDTVSELMEWMEQSSLSGTPEDAAYAYLEDEAGDLLDHLSGCIDWRRLAKNLAEGDLLVVTRLGNVYRNW